MQKGYPIQDVIKIKYTIDQLYLSLIIDCLRMTSLQCSPSLSQLNALELRRSDRKKTKKIFKDDFMLPNPFKGKSKKQRSLRLPQNLDCQIKRIQFLTQRTLAMLNYGKQQFSVQMLNEMKQAVNQQQTKLSEFLSIKLIGEKNTQENRIYSNLTKNQKLLKENQNTPKIQENTIAGQYQNDHDFHKQVLGVATAEQIYGQFSGHLMQNQDNISAFHEESGYYLAEAPRFRKQSSKLLSDNYENNELFYTIDHMIPAWHKEEIELEEQSQFLD